METLISLLIVAVIWSLNLMMQSKGMLVEEDKKSKWGRNFILLGYFLAPIGIAFMIASVAADLHNSYLSFGIAIGISSTGLVVEGEVLRGKDKLEIGGQLKSWSWVLWAISAFTIIAIIVVGTT